MHAQEHIDQLSVNTIRTLSMDAVQAANSGHPGTPMALAPVVYTLWQRSLRFDPADDVAVLQLGGEGGHGAPIGSKWATTRANRSLNRCAIGSLWWVR